MQFTRSQKRRLFSIISGTAFFILGCAFSLLHLEIAGAVSFVAAGVAAGYMCVIQAVRGIASKDFFDENMLMTIAAVGAVLLGEYPECAAIIDRKSVV